jgi:hypothetical protein
MYATAETLQSTHPQRCNDPLDWIILPDNDIGSNTPMDINSNSMKVVRVLSPWVARWQTDCAISTLHYESGLVSCCG